MDIHRMSPTVTIDMLWFTMSWKVWWWMTYGKQIKPYMLNLMVKKHVHRHCFAERWPWMKVEAVFGHLFGHQPSILWPSKYGHFSPVMIRQFRVDGRKLRRMHSSFFPTIWCPYAFWGLILCPATRPCSSLRSHSCGHCDTSHTSRFSGCGQYQYHVLWEVCVTYQIYNHIINE